MNILFLHPEPYVRIDKEAKALKAKELNII
jgi:hypothetical protein